jgi:P27 family predicted phage terminase small subunit
MAGVRGRSGGSNRKSVEQHHQQGTFRRDRHGEVDREATAAPEPPAYLDEGAQAVWRELMPSLAAFGLFTALDGPKLELLCIHVAHHRRLYVALNACLAKCKASGTPVDTSRMTRALRQEASTIQHLAAGFGLDPADRVRLRVPRPPSEPSNPLSRLLQASAVRRGSKWAGVLP